MNPNLHPILSSSRGRSLRSSYGYSSYQAPPTAPAANGNNTTPASGHLSLAAPVATATRLPLQDSPHDLKKRIQQQFDEAHADRYFLTLQEYERLLWAFTQHQRQVLHWDSQQSSI